MMPCTWATTPVLPRMYRGVRGLPAGFSVFTRTRSPNVNWPVVLCIIAFLARRVGCGRGEGLRGRERLRDADQALLRDEPRQLGLAHSLGASGPAGQHHPANVRGTVVHANRHLL